MQYFEKKNATWKTFPEVSSLHLIFKKKKERNSKVVVWWHFLWWNVLQAICDLIWQLRKKTQTHWFTTSFMKQSIYGFCISNLLMYFAQKAFELASIFHKERSKGTRVSKHKTRSTRRVCILEGKLSHHVSYPSLLSPHFQSSAVLLESHLTFQSKGI